MHPDVAELGRLIDAHATALELFARQWTDAAADVVQESFLEWVRQPAPPDDPAAWLFRVVRNRAISAARSESRRKRHESAAASHVHPWFESSLEGWLDAAAATEMLRELPDDQREIVVAHLWGGLTFEQIATVAGTSYSAAHRKYASALHTLRQRWKVPCPEN